MCTEVHFDVLRLFRISFWILCDSTCKAQRWWTIHKMLLGVSLVLPVITFGKGSLLDCLPWRYIMTTGVWIEIVTQHIRLRDNLVNNWHVRQRFSNQDPISQTSITAEPDKLVQATVWYYGLQLPSLQCLSVPADYLFFKSDKLVKVTVWHHIWVAIADLVLSCRLPGDVLASWTTVNLVTMWLLWKLLSGQASQSPICILRK